MNNKYWDGNFGLLGLLAIPILSLSLIIFILNYWSSFAEAILVISILIYCISPKKLLSQFDKYIISIEKEEADASVLAQQLINKEITNNSDNVEVAIMKSFFVAAHKQILAAIFWYFVLGVVGVLLYRLADKLHDELSNVSSSFSESTSILLNILEWPSTRVFAIGLALAGNLVGVISILKKSDIFSIETSNSLLTDIGIAALQYSSELDAPNQEKSYWLNQFKFLVIRALIILIFIVGIIILSGIN
jgi:membrane protein required for beta-lactamase induction